MVAFRSLLPVPFDIALPLLMTLLRYVKSSTSSNGSWSTVITASDGTNCIMFVLFLLMFSLVLHVWKDLQTI